MSFQAYLDNIQKNTGKSPEDFKALAKAQGFVSDDGLATGVKATQVTDWLQEEFGLGHGHAMALYAWLKGKRE